METTRPLASISVGSAVSVVGDAAREAAEAASPEASVTDGLELALTAAFGPVSRWWPGPDGLRLPLP